MHRHSNPAARTLKVKALAVAIAASFATSALANPVGPTVAAGNATFATSGNTLTVVNTPGTIINWQQFNIGQNEITRFMQQSNQSTVLNRITGQDPSQILGTLQSNGRVFLVNPNGILFGQNAVIDVFGLVASNLNLANADFLAGRFSFNGGGAGAVVNQGAITTPVGGTVYLIGSSVANQGLITSPKGEVVLAAGNSVSLADTGTPNLSVTLNAAGNKAVNIGRITADGGRIDIYGALIEQQGVLRADSASMDEQGRVVLKATQATTVGGEIGATNSAGNGGTVQVLGDEVALASTAKIDASGATGGGTVLVGGDLQGKNAAVQNATTTRVAAGATIKADATDKGNGGKVIVWSDDKAFFDGLIYARGGANGGDGGFAETSGHSIRVGGMVNTTAPKGKAGTWLLDPAIGCVSDNVVMCPAGAEATSTSVVEQALALNSALQYTATDYFMFVTAQPWVVSPSVPATGTITIEAPHIILNGSVNAVTNGKAINFHIRALSGMSATYPTKTGVITIPSGGKELRTLGDVELTANKTVEVPADATLQSRYLSLHANDYFSFTGNGGSGTFVGNSGPSSANIWAPYISLNGTIPLASNGGLSARVSDPGSSQSSATFPSKTGTLDVNATFVGQGGAAPSSSTPTSHLTLSAPTINGAVVFSQFSSSPAGYYGYVNIEADKLNATFAGAIDYLSLHSYWIWNNGPITAVPTYVGTAASDPVCATGLCINTQLAQLTLQNLQFGGGYGWSTSSGTTTVGYGGDVYYNGAPSLASVPQTVGMGGPKIVINSPVAVAQYAYVDAYESFTNNAGPNAFSGVQYQLAVTPNPVLNGLTPTVISTPYPAYPCDAPGYPTCAAKTAAFEAHNAELAAKNYPAHRLSYLDKTGGAVPPPTPLITFSGNYAGTFTGTFSGTWTLNVSSTGAITGTAHNSDGTVATLSGNAAANGNLSFASGGASTGEHFTGTYNASTGVLSGSWSNSATGASGHFTNQAAPVVTTDTVTQQTVAKAVADTCATNAALCTSSTQQQTTASAAAAAETGSGAKGKLTVDEKLKKAEDKKAAEDKKSEDKKVAEEKKQPEDKKQAEQKKVEVAKQKQEAKAAEERKSPAELKQEAKQAQAEAKKVEAEAKKVEAEAKTVEAEAKQASSAAKKAEPEARKAEAEAKKAEAEIKTAKTPERKATAEAKKAEAEAKVAEVEAKKVEADSKQAQAASKKVEAEAKKAAHDAKEAEAEHKLALAEAKEAKTPQAKAEAQGKAAEKQVEATRKKAEGEVKQAKAEEHKVEAAQKKAETEAKQAEHNAKQAEAGAKKAEADAARAKQAGKPDEEKKALAQKAEHEKKAEAHQKQAEAKQAEASAKKAEQRKMAEERRSQAAKAFGGAVVAAVMPEKLAEMAALRHEYKTEVLKPALTVLEQNPKAADMPACGAGSGDVCVPVKAAVAEAAKQPAAQLVSALPKPAVAFVPQIERKVAVLVGINNYADKNIPPLESAVPDVEAVGKMMAEKLGYEVRVVRDATKADIVKAINAVGREVGPNDSVAIYYAGHGYLSEKTNTGYWIPADSSAQSPANWISNDDIARLLQQVPAKQVMLVSDSCYSGSLTREGKVGSGGGVEDILGKRSVTVMSSGGEEPVSDEGKDGHSIFAWSLMDSLKKVDRFEPGAKLFDQVKRGVVEEYPQVPQYGAATSAGHAAGGDYLLEVRSYK